MSEAIHNSEDDELMLVEEMLMLVFHVLRRTNVYHCILTTCMVDPLLKDEQNWTDRSRDMPVQSSQIASTTLVECSKTQQTLVQKL